MTTEWKPLPPQIRAAVWDKTCGKCWYCGNQTNPFLDFTVDHFNPQSNGGNHELSNLVPCCRSCNSRKRNLTDISRFRYLLARDQRVMFTVEQLDYLAEIGIDLPPQLKPDYEFYFEKMGLSAEGYSYSLEDEVHSE